MSCAQPPRSDSGFTLVEAMVSLFVFGLIASGSVAMLMQSVASQRAVSEAQASLRGIQTARVLLETDMLQIVQRAARGSDDARAPIFLGASGQGVSFVRASSDIVAGQSVGRLSAVTYRLTPDGALVRASRDGVDPLPGEAGVERVVLRDLRNARFEFYDGDVWHAQWSATTVGGALPRAVALEGETPRYGRVRIVALVELSR